MMVRFPGGIWHNRRNKRETRFVFFFVVVFLLFNGVQKRKAEPGIDRVPETDLIRIVFGKLL